MKRVIEYLNSIFSNGDTVVIGVSGGPDSMCLLKLLIDLKEKFNLNIVCAHVNHNTRFECESEKEFVLKYANNNNLKFEYLKIENYAKGTFNEQEAHKRRYNFFNSLALKYNAKFIMTAHHGDDLVETILMRITRGSNLRGYKGIDLITQKENIFIVRPLLYITKTEIIEYMQNLNLSYVVDSSNESENYTRNRYRKHMLPLLKKENKLIHLKYMKFSNELNEYYKYVDNIVSNKYMEIYDNGSLIVNKLIIEDKFIIKKIIERYIDNFRKEIILDINDNLIDEIISLLGYDGNKKIDLKGNYIASKSYNKFTIEKEDSFCYDKEEVLVDGLLFNNYIFNYISDSDEIGNDIIRISSEELSLPLKVRTRNDGDFIRILNLNGKKKIKDIFIDEKIDAKKRKNYPIVIDSNNVIVWIPFLKKSIFDKKNSEKYDIIIKCTEKERKENE